MENLFNLFYETSGICTDTRKIEKDCLFICLKGENFNGNTFAEKALEQGAKYVIADEKEYQTKEHIYLVENALHFLQQLGNFHRKKFNIPVIGITGSNGKTSTKELINAVLSTHYDVLATKGNLNNHIGVPLTLLELKQHHQIAIIEMGANHFGDIKELCDIAEPNYGIITNIGKAHLEGFLNFEGVLKTKRELYESVAKASGTIVYNHDDEVLVKNLPDGVSLHAYGTQKSAIEGELVALTPYVEFNWKTINYTSPTIQTHLVGKYNFYNFLAAVTFGTLFNVPEQKINEGISNYIPSNNRSQIQKTADNTLILDCYNANPTSMKSAIESFALSTGNKLAILGDMLELGHETAHEHLTILNLLSQLEIPACLVGPFFHEMNAQNSYPTILHTCKTTDEMIEYIKEHPVQGKLVLLKGSRGIGLEKLEKFL